MKSLDIMAAFLFTFSMSLFHPAYGSDVVADPVGDYVKWVRGPHHGDIIDMFMSNRKPTILERVLADIDGDNKKEVLLTVRGLANGMEGLLWDVYTPVDGGYRNIGGVTFHPKAFHVGDFEEYGWGIVRYFHASSAEGMLIFTQLKNGRTVDTPIRKISPKYKPEDMKLYDSLFNNKDQPHVEEIPLSSFPEPEAPTVPATPQPSEAPPNKDTSVPQTPTSPEPSPTAPPSDTLLPVSDKPSAANIPPATVTHPSWTRIAIPALGIMLAIVVIVTLLLYLRTQKSKRGKKGDGNP